MPVFPPFYVPHRTQETLKRFYLSQDVVFWSKIRYPGSKRQSEYSRREYVALPVVLHLEPAAHGHGQLEPSLVRLIGGSGEYGY